MDEVSNGLAGLVSMFFAALVAATIFPAQSELVLAGLQHTRDYSPYLLVAVATIGNVAGSVINWLLGRYLVRFKERKWFPFKETAVARTTRLYQKWGVWTLLLAWLPIVGDPLTLVAGVFKTNIWLFLILVTIGKCLRYVGIIMVV